VFFSPVEVAKPLTKRKENKARWSRLRTSGCRSRVCRDNYIDLMSGVPPIAAELIALRKSAALGHRLLSARVSLTAGSRHEIDPLFLLALVAGASWQSIRRGDKVRQRINQLFRFDWFMHTRRFLQRWNIHVTIAVAGNNYKGYVSRDQGVGKIERPLAIQIEIQHDSIRPILFKESKRFGLSRHRADHAAAFALEPILKIHCHEELVFNNQDARPSQGGAGERRFLH
jgi:hypothetical protein